MKRWFVWHWEYGTPFLAVAMLVLLTAYVLPNYGWPLYLLWIQTVVYLIHQWEEYVWPGGFIQFFNKYMMGCDEKYFPMSKEDSFWINIPLIWIAYPLSALASGYWGLAIGIWCVWFSFLNGFSHVVMSIKFHLPYNPGLVVSCLLNIPVAAFTLYYFIAYVPEVTLTHHIIGAVVGIIAQAVMMWDGFFRMKPRIKKREHGEVFEIENAYS